MSPQPAIDALNQILDQALVEATSTGSVQALAALRAYEDPLLPFYEALGPERPLTLRAIRDHGRLLRDCTGRAQDQVDAIQRVIERCQRLPPTPLSNLPLGF